MNRIDRFGRWLVVHFDGVQNVLSWAVVGGGRRTARAVVWYQADRNDLEPPVDPELFLCRKLEGLGLPDAIGLLTSRDLDTFVETRQSEEGLSIGCLATIGLSNALRIGDAAVQHTTCALGTINLLCWLSAPLSEEALVEAISLVAEARTEAVLESEIPSKVSGLPATGTGTDCIVVAAPRTGKPNQYAGKHTLIGHLIGTTVGEAVRQGIEEWRAEWDV